MYQMELVYLSMNETAKFKTAPVCVVLGEIKAKYGHLVNDLKSYVELDQTSILIDDHMCKMLFSPSYRLLFSARVLLLFNSANVDFIVNVSYR